jgi:hypothetical protein
MAHILSGIGEWRDLTSLQLNHTLQNLPDGGYTASLLEGSLLATIVVKKSSFYYTCSSARESFEIRQLSSVQIELKEFTMKGKV